MTTGVERTGQTPFGDDYSGAVDWDKIYRACHGAGGVAESVQAILGPGSGAVTFSGFPQAAAELGRLRPLTFVDCSEQVIAEARRLYPSLQTPRLDDVIEFLAGTDCALVALTGRLSAFWNGDDFERLAAALETFPRQCVIIDFFDVARIQAGRSLQFDGSGIRGSWFFWADITSTVQAPTVHRLRQRVIYEGSTAPVDYETERSFFQQADVLAWCAHRLPRFQPRFEPPLIHGDPGFTLVLTSR